MRRSSAFRANSDMCFIGTIIACSGSNSVKDMFYYGIRRLGKSGFRLFDKQLRFPARLRHETGGFRLRLRLRHGSGKRKARLRFLAGVFELYRGFILRRGGKLARIFCRVYAKRLRVRLCGGNAFNNCGHLKKDPFF